MLATDREIPEKQIVVNIMKLKNTETFGSLLKYLGYKATISH